MYAQLLTLALTVSARLTLRVAHRTRSKATRQRLRELAAQIRPCRVRTLGIVSAITLPAVVSAPIDTAEVETMPTPHIEAYTVSTPIVEVMPVCDIGKASKANKATKSRKRKFTTA